MAHPTKNLLRIRRLYAAGAAVLAVGMALVTGISAPAAATDSADNVKYYVVASSYQGKPENLTEIATRFLGSGSRSAEIFMLNAGLKQPDGGALTDPAVLHPGWVLVLPWDAVGTGVQYGRPGTTPASSGSGGKSPGAKGTPTKSPASPRPGQTAQPRTSTQCATASASSGQSDWASLRLAPDKAWAHSRGSNQLVAVIDSGVDASLARLAGHVSAGADIAAGSGRGDSDCLGTGTAMAGIIVAQPAQNTSLAGIAPDTTVMPVRVVGTTPTTPTAQPDDQATAITIAVAAGATVIALGSYIDPSNAKVAAAIAAATSHDVVVVVGAGTSDKPAIASGGDGAVLRVGAVGVNGQLVTQYVPGTVDVVAPGLNVATLGMNGSGTQTVTGTQYAVAFVAGEAALVRAAYPMLSAVDVCHQIEATADKLSANVPDGRFGYGMINPGASVEQAPSVGPGSAAGQRAKASTGLGSASGRMLVSVVAGLVGLIALVLLVLRVRRLLRTGNELDPALAAEAAPGPDGLTR